MTAILPPHRAAPEPNHGEPRILPAVRGAEAPRSVGTGISSSREGRAGFQFAVEDSSESPRCGKAGSVRLLLRSVVGLMLWLGTMGCAVIPERAVHETSLTTFVASSPATDTQVAHPPLLRVAGRHFVDEQGRVVILRGVNLSGDSKVPPFSTAAGPADLDLLRDLGFNVIRLLFLWEAYEPSPGVYNDRYVNDLRAVVAAARERGIAIVIDFHQDGFSRFASRGAGDGFPHWAVSPRGRVSKPDNGPASKHWAVLMATDPTTHKSFADFFADRNGVRTRYLAMVGLAAAEFAHEPGVIGYDLLNEPWGDERTDLAPLYRDAAEVIRTVHPSAIVFLEGHLSTNCGMSTRLPQPDFGPVAYAPHYYRPITVMLGRWHGTTLGMNRAFANMIRTAQTWDTPLFLGEFGVSAESVRAGDYVSAIYDRLDACLASGAQWNYTPRWNAQTKDGWNAEDFNILDPSGTLRPQLPASSLPAPTAGTPLRFCYSSSGTAGQSCGFEFDWNHDPDRGETEIFVPNALFGARTIVEIEGSGATWYRDPTRQVLVCRAASAVTIHLKVTAPAEAGRLAAGTSDAPKRRAPVESADISGSRWKVHPRSADQRRFVSAPC